MEEIEIIKPDDWHVHFRDNEILNAVVPETTRHFARSIVMPNLIQENLLKFDSKLDANILDLADVGDTGVALDAMKGAYRGPEFTDAEIEVDPNVFEQYKKSLWKRNSLTR